MDPQGHPEIAGGIEGMKGVPQVSQLEELRPGNMLSGPILPLEWCDLRIENLRNLLKVAG